MRLGEARFLPSRQIGQLIGASALLCASGAQAHGSVTLFGAPYAASGTKERSPPLGYDPAKRDEARHPADTQPGRGHAASRL